MQGQHFDAPSSLRGERTPDGHLAPNDGWYGVIIVTTLTTATLVATRLSVR